MNGMEWNGMEWNGMECTLCNTIFLAESGEGFRASRNRPIWGCVPFEGTSSKKQGHRPSLRPAYVMYRQLLA
jgi:hypothetical protein